MEEASDDFGELYTDYAVPRSFGSPTASSSRSGAAPKSQRSPLTHHHRSVDQEPHFTDSGEGGGFENEELIFYLQEDDKDLNYKAKKVKLGAGFGERESDVIFTGSATEPLHEGKMADPARAGGDGDGWESDDSDGPQIIVNDSDLDATGSIGRGALGRYEEKGIEAKEAFFKVYEDAQTHVQPRFDGHGGKQNLDVPNVGCSCPGYYPFPDASQYGVRPGAEPPTAVVPAGPISGRDIMYEGYHSGFGGPNWQNRGSGRSSHRRLDFTLPNYETIFEVHIDSLEEKPWRYPGADVSDYFNFGLNEDTWKEYCEKITGQAISVECSSTERLPYYESQPPRASDPDVIIEIKRQGSSEGETSVEDDALSPEGQPDGDAQIVPIGRAIPVECGSDFEERLPSSDTQPPRDSSPDVIEIKCQVTPADET